MTSLSHGAGCACKLSLDELRSVLDGVAPVTHPDLVVGLDTGDDAAVWRLADGTHLVATTDFFTPLVDDPHDWGRIAAANAVSDVFAMGAQPRFGLNVLGWPRDLPFALLREVLAGAAEVANEAGYPLVGGHSIDSAEPLYGQAVVGEVEPAALLTNAGAKVRQAVVLTKPLGTGIVTTALKRASSAEAREPMLAAAYDAAVASMTRLNRDAALAARAIGATAATDVTGFGLLGHLHRLAAASGAAVDLQVEQVPVLPHVAELRDAGAVPGGTRRNADQAHRFISGAVDDPTLLVLADAQTSGGLLITCAPVAADDLVAQLRDTGHDAARIATIVDGEPGTIRLLR